MDKCKSYRLKPPSCGSSPPGAHIFHEPQHPHAVVPTFPYAPVSIPFQNRNYSVRPEGREISPPCSLLPTSSFRLHPLAAGFAPALPSSPFTCRRSAFCTRFPAGHREAALRSPFSRAGLRGPPRSTRFQRALTPAFTHSLLPLIKEHSPEHQQGEQQAQDFSSNH